MSDCGFEWQCANCGAMTRDTYIVAEGWATDMCIACRGYEHTTPGEASAEARADAWHGHMREQVGVSSES